jgi:hypothetical protein
MLSPPPRTTEGAQMPKRRINTVLSEKTFKDLDTLAREQGKSKAEVLRDAVALERWFEDARQEGGKILLERDGQVREIIAR